MLCVGDVDAICIFGIDVHTQNIRVVFQDDPCKILNLLKKIFFCRFAKWFISLLENAPLFCVC